MEGFAGSVAILGAGTHAIQVVAAGAVHSLSTEAIPLAGTPSCMRRAELTGVHPITTVVIRRVKLIVGEVTGVVTGEDVDIGEVTGVVTGEDVEEAMEEFTTKMFRCIKPRHTFTEASKRKHSFISI